jgi:hypothetical protein
MVSVLLVTEQLKVLLLVLQPKVNEAPLRLFAMYGCCQRSPFK